MNYTRQSIDPNILSVLDVNTTGKVVSAKDWRELWGLVINHINTIDEYCISIEDIRVNWETSEAALNEVIAEFRAKYDTLSKSFIHYGEEPPEDEHTKLWIQPVEDVSGDSFITYKDLTYQGILENTVVLDTSMKSGLYIIKENTTLQFSNITNYEVLSPITDCITASNCILIAENTISGISLTRVSFKLFGTLKNHTGSIFSANTVMLNGTTECSPFTSEYMDKFGEYTYTADTGHVLNLKHSGTDKFTISYGSGSEDKTISLILQSNVNGKPVLNIVCGNNATGLKFNGEDIVVFSELAAGLSTKVNAVDGKQLSTNDYTDSDKTKLMHMPTNLKNGSATGSLRTIGSQEENSAYTIGNYAFSEGQNTRASGYSSHAEGYYAVASGDYSHAEGYTTIASSYQHVQGMFNIYDKNHIYADIVGNGDEIIGESNAYTLDWNGNGWFSGDVYVGSTSGTNRDEGSKKLATEAYVDTKIGDIDTALDNIISLQNSYIGGNS